MLLSVFIDLSLPFPLNSYDLLSCALCHIDASPHCQRFALPDQCQNGLHWWDSISHHQEIEEESQSTMKSSKLVAAIGVGSYRVYWRRERKGKVELQENNMKRNLGLVWSYLEMEAIKGRDWREKEGRKGKKKGKKKGAREGWVPIIGGKGILVFSWIW